MSSPIAFPFIPTRNKERELVWQDVEFLFTIRAAKELEEVAGCGPGHLVLRGQSVKALVLMVWHALKHADPTITEKKAETAIQKYLDAGGKVKPLSEALYKAMNEAGVYGDPDVPEAPDEDEQAEDADPLKTPTPA